MALFGKTATQFFSATIALFLAIDAHAQSNPTPSSNTSLGTPMTGASMSISHRMIQSDGARREAVATKTYLLELSGPGHHFIATVDARGDKPEISVVVGKVAKADGGELLPNQVDPFVFVLPDVWVIGSLPESVVPKALERPSAIAMQITASEYENSVAALSM